MELHTKADRRLEQDAYIYELGIYHYVIRTFHGTNGFSSRKAAGKSDILNTEYESK